MQLQNAARPPTSDSDFSIMKIAIDPVGSAHSEPDLRNVRLWSYADKFAALMAVSLPWSTTIFGISTILWLITLAGAIDVRQLGRLVTRLPSALPITLFCLAVVGMFWADVPWGARVHATGSLIKLLAIPLLIYQFNRSENGITILLSFLASCTALLFLSWLNWFEPRTVLFPVKALGVPVKNWITQGVEFVLCIFGSAALAIVMWHDRRPYEAFGLALLAVAFLLNMVFVASASRTSLVSIPALLLISTFRYLGWKRSLTVYVILSVLVGLAWLTAPNLRNRLESIQDEYTSYTRGQKTSVGLRLEYWTNSLKFISMAPLVGHGTGSIRSLFEREVGQKSADSPEIVANPHNQTLYFAIEWGVIGIILLYSMWITHFLMFTEMRWIAWLGIIVVSQNILDSLFNSHLSDYVEGWIYVMGVGIAAGMVTRTRKEPVARFR